MNPATGWIVLTCLLILGGLFAWLMIAATIDLADAIRAYRNDRRDARDVKRGVL